LTEQLVSEAEASRFSVDTVDVGPVALYNAVRYNGGRLGESTLVMDIGARSANLLFLENDTFYARTVPVAGNAITRQISREFDLPFAEAEDLKRTQASAPGADDEGDEIAARASKAVGTVLQRLVAETSRTVNFYRTQQNGSPPKRVLLTGGTAMLRGIDAFLSQKLRVPVEFLNPVVGVEMGEEVDLAELSSVGHLIGTVIGLGVRKLPRCPLQVNLLPPRVRARHRFLRREPYLIASAAGVLLLMTAWWVSAAKVGEMFDKKVGVELKPEVERLRRLERDLDEARERYEDVERRFEQVNDIMDRRLQWMVIVQALTEALPADVWITRLVPSSTPLAPGAGGEDGEGGEGALRPSEGMPGGYPMMPGAPPMGMPGAPPGMMMMPTEGEGGEGAPISTDIVALQVEGSVYLNPQEKEQLDLLFRNRLREMTDLFVPDQTEIVEAPLPRPGDIIRPFRMVVALQEPIVQ
jgi:type IV pilus assembly protein PilM